MKIIDSTDPKTQEYLQKIGRVIVELNFIENFVELLIWQLIGAKEVSNVNDEQAVGRRITVNLSFIEKADLLRSLVVERKGEEFTKEFTDDIYKKLQVLSEKRNDVAHSTWLIQYGSNKEAAITHKINYGKAFVRGKPYDFDKAKSNISLEEFDQYLELIDDVGAYLIHYGVNKL